MSPKCRDVVNLGPTCHMSATFPPTWHRMTAWLMQLQCEAVTWCHHVNAPKMLLTQWLSPHVACNNLQHNVVHTIVILYFVVKLSFEWYFNTQKTAPSSIKTQQHVEFAWHHNQSSPPINQRLKQRTTVGRNHSGITHHKRDALSNRSSPKAYEADHPIGTMLPVHRWFCGLLYKSQLDHHTCGDVQIWVKTVWARVI